MTYIVLPCGKQDIGDISIWLPRWLLLAPVDEETNDVGDITKLSFQQPEEPLKESVRSAWSSMIDNLLALTEAPRKLVVATRDMDRELRRFLNIAAPEEKVKSVNMDIEGNAHLSDEFINSDIAEYMGALMTHYSDYMQAKRAKKREAKERKRNKTGFKLIGGKMTTREKAIAYCDNATHWGYLTPKLMKSHQCLKKQCPYFRKEDVIYWRELEEKRQRAKEHRAAKKLAAKGETDLEKARRILGKCEGIFVTNVLRDRIITVSFIANSPNIRINEELQNQLRYVLEGRIYLRRVRTSIQNRRALIKPPKYRTEISAIPGVGRVTQLWLADVGIYNLKALAGSKPEKLYKMVQNIAEETGEYIDRRVLNAFIAAVEYAKKAGLSSAC
ncbi:MAG: helix-hairpin-helix domain-containing protein [Oscillospiraceae bacterium]|jgi:hypothetical protein|nr:helix-hairpin-helix domain-containing protein [Oscillospiraceae bacterium]